jgi:hypothetical protein
MNPQRFKNPHITSEKFLVSIIAGKVIMSMIREAVSLRGGLEKMGVKGSLGLFS